MCFFFSRNYINFATYKKQTDNMKKIFAIMTLAFSVSLISCSGNADGSSSQTTSDVADTTAAQVVDSTATSTAPSEKAPSIVTTTSDNPTATPAAILKDKGPVKPDSEADKLLKQYNEAFLDQVQAIQTGKELGEADKQRFIDLQNSLEQMEKSGKLSEQQKQLLKATTDAYNQFKKK